MEDGPDKTKIKPKATASASPDKTRTAPVKKQASQQDKTRIAPAKKQAPRQDKTRIASSNSSQESTKDKTRIAVKNNKGSQKKVDATQFKPRQPTASDKTRVAPRKKPVSTQQEFPSSLETSPQNSGNNRPKILKKRFVLESVLGAGGMGVVYKAKDLLKVEAQDRDPYVAIKVLSEEFKSHPEAFISLQRESRKSQRIAHPNIVNVHDFDRDNDTVFMTMEFLDGSPLDELISKYHSTGLPTDDSWTIIQGMSSALSYAHAEHIIHSDFKPGNVFVTKKNVTKVFDFGIARAVAQVEHLEDNPNDVTLFDPGNLGALTPAYASLEMLEGKEPDVRDDIYALGCVAYEMLTGQHPFNKIPADEAERQGLKPKRINHIKKHQWRIIEKAIAFRREDRVETVDQFVEGISQKSKTSNPWIALAAFILLATGAGGYYVYFQQQNTEPQFSEFDIRNELELKIRIDFHKENIQSLIKGANFSNIWQDSIWKDISDLTTLTRGKDVWVDEHNLIVFNLYLARIKEMIDKTSFGSAKQLIENAKRYTKDEIELVRLNDQIKSVIEQEQVRKKLVAQQLQDKKKAQIARQKESVRQKQQQTKKITQQKELKQQFDIALENVNNQLKCQDRLNMRNFEAAVKKLKQLNPSRYRDLEKNVINSLAACIATVGKAFPERATEAKKHALRLFKSSRVLSSISIKSRDPCDISLAGLGARGKRTICKDKLKGSETGPELVVIPGNNKIEAFAIGKYEVSIDEMNKFCKHSASCQPMSTSNGELPVSEITLKTARAYLKWLSAQSGRKYRLPSKNEWIYAAKSRRKTLDPNRNCELSTRGFQKGGELVNARIGKQNSWGLVNYVGNVQEWVYDSGRKLVAAGGSYQQAMESCDVNTILSHDGGTDRATGLRVLRELRNQS